MKRFSYLRCVMCGKKQKSREFQRRRCISCGLHTGGWVRPRRKHFDLETIGSIYGCSIYTSDEIKALRSKYGMVRRPWRHRAVA